MPPSRLGPLALESKLGDHPSTSTVWRAIHIELKRSIAVKLFPIPFGSTPEARRRLADEWETLKQIRHPAIAQCYGGGFEESNAYLAYELIEGSTLASMIEMRGRLGWETTIDTASSLSEALQVLHGRGICHGAVVPSKVVFGGLSPVMIDTRVDRFSTPYRNNRPPTADEVACIPPEMIGNPSAASVAADLHMLGSLMYQMITGRFPEKEAMIGELGSSGIASPATLVMDTPVYLDRLVMQLLSDDPKARPRTAEAVIKSLAEVRRKATSKTSVVEHAASGFSPITVTNQSDRETARDLMGRDPIRFEDELPTVDIPWHDRPGVIVGGIALICAIICWAVWPLNENQLRAKAETLLETKRQTDWMQAKNSYLQPLINRFPNGEHADWARNQIDRIEMSQAEQALDVKIKRNFKLSNEAERLYAEARRYERFGDKAQALDRYRSMVTLLDDDPQYKPFVNLARRQIAGIEETPADSEASTLLKRQLDQAEQLMLDGQVLEARKIWYSIIELYGDNDSVAPLVRRAQERLEGDPSENKARANAPEPSKAGSQSNPNERETST
ncbi:MAG: serine/threonine-protein kinase [Planctomycetota bacterium]